MKTKIFVLSILFLCSGCGKAEMSNARMNHLLALDHGWLDLSIQSLPQVKGLTGDYRIELSVNGELFFGRMQIS